MESGLMGDVASVGGGVSEARIHHGPGYRLYYTIRERTLIILLVGGDKSSQARDIEKAKEMADQIRRQEFVTWSFGRVTWPSRSKI